MYMYLSLTNDSKSSNFLEYDNPLLLSRWNCVFVQLDLQLLYCKTYKKLSGNYKYTLLFFLLEPSATHKLSAQMKRSTCKVHDIVLCRFLMFQKSSYFSFLRNNETMSDCCSLFIIVLIVAFTVLPFFVQFDSFQIFGKLSII